MVYIRGDALFLGDMLEENNVRIQMWSRLLQTLLSVDKFIYLFIGAFWGPQAKCNLVPSYLGEGRHPLQAISTKLIKSHQDNIDG